MKALITFFRTAGWQKTVGAALVTIITLGIVAVAGATTTSAGCGMARALGLTHLGGRCLAQRPVAGISTPSSPSPRASLAPATTPPQPPQQPGTSSYPPADSGYPPTNPPASSVPPGLDGVSGYPYNGSASGVGSYPSGLQCSLPFYAGPPGSGGFVTFPGGNFIADPKSAVTTPTPPGASPTPQQGYGPNYSGLTYDRRYSRWLPVTYRSASPDGTHYAFLSSGAIYGVTVSTGVMTELGEGSWTIIDVKDEGVYAEVVNNPGLWLLPYSGTPRQITTKGFWQAVGGGAAYGTVTSAVPAGAVSTILRLDLSTGNSTDWFNRGTEVASVVGFDAAGHPLIVSQGPSGGSLWLSTGAMSGIPIYIPSPNSYEQHLNINPPMITDGHGVWFTGNWYGYNSNGPVIVLMTNSTLYGVSALGGQLAGPCA